MITKIKQIRAASSARQLLMVNFATLTLLAVAFLLIILYFRSVHQHVFNEVGRATEEISNNSEIRRSLVQVELDIRDLLSRILHQPGGFKAEQQQLVDDFGQLILRITDRADNDDEIKLQELLGSYRASLVDILRNYNEINQRLIALDGYYERFSSSLDLMGDKAGELMVEATLEGRNTSGLQQTYILVPFCRERLLQAQVLIESSVSSNFPGLLGVSSDEDNDVKTVLGNFAVLEKTLRTLTSGDELVSVHVRTLLKELPPYREEIDKLYHILTVMLSDQQRFEILRRDVMVEQERIFSQTTADVSNVKEVVLRYDNRAIISISVISIIVLIMSFLGFLIIRKVGLHLEREIEERRQTEVELKKARDGLDEKVRERTDELSSANKMLREEVNFRVATEIALADEKEKLAVTLRSIGDGVITVDIQSKVVFLNKVAENLTGWSQEEAAGHFLSEVFRVVDSKSREPITDLIENIVSSGNIVQLSKEMLLIARDGVERSIADSGAPIRDKDSLIVGVVLVFRDVTGKEKIEAELMKIRKLESVGVLAGGIAHDFNNILAAILGNINLALMSTAPDDRRHGLLVKAEKASLRAKDLTQQLLTFSKGGEPVKKITSISEIIEDSASFIMRGSNVKCSYNFAEGLWPVEIDPGQMSQVVQNIILNASHAMPDGGLIEISGENLVNTDRHIPVDGDELVRITIRDYGSGIPAEVLERVFDPYFTTKNEGNGLGLAITHSIIAKHGGHIMVDSRLGEGTTFTIYLVGRSGEGSEKACKGEAIVAGKKGAGKVMVMDDEHMVRDIAAEMLRYLGYEVVTVKDGAEAIDVYRQDLESGCPVDVILIDLTIPGGMGGKEAIKKLLELDPQVKAIVSSGYSNDPVVSDYRTYGFLAMIHKPFRLNELAGTISRLIKS